MAKKSVRLSKHVYGQDHILVGTACFYEGKPVIVYGSYTIAPNEHTEPGVRLAVLFCDDESVERKPKAMSGVKPKELIQIAPSDLFAKAAMHVMLARLLTCKPNLRSGE